MTRNVTLIVETDDMVHRALQLRAARENAAIAAVVNDILRLALAGEIDEASGMPPLADAIQAHHDRELREARQPPSTQTAT